VIRRVVRFFPNFSIFLGREPSNRLDIFHIEHAALASFAHSSNLGDGWDETNIALARRRRAPTSSTAAAHAFPARPFRRVGTTLR